MVCSLGILSLALLVTGIPLGRGSGGSAEKREAPVQSDLTNLGQAVLVPAGERLTARLSEELSSVNTRVGQRCRLETAHEIFLGLNGEARLRPGLPIWCEVVKSHGRKRPFRSAAIGLESREIELSEAHRVPVQATVARIVGGGVEVGPNLLLPKGTYFDLVLEQNLWIPGGSPVLDRWHPGMVMPQGMPRVQQVGVSGNDAVQPPAALSRGDSFSLKTVVDRVLVEAIVRDQQGRVLGSLTKEDFRVREDGVPQQVLEFVPVLRPLAVALVIDCSASIEPFRRELRDAASETLAQLGLQDRVALVGFSEKVELLEELTDDHTAIAERLPGLVPSGRTNVYDAVQEASYYLYEKAPEFRRAIVMISDNWATEIEGAGEGGALRMALQTSTAVHSIKLPGSDRLPRLDFVSKPVWMGDGELVERFVNATGGDLIEVEKNGSLSKALAAAILGLKQRYALCYASSSRSRAGYRTIEVELDQRHGQPGRDYFVRARQGYYAGQ